MKKLLIVLLVGFTILSCQKEGPAGADGQDGNANVKSYEKTVNPNQWYDLSDEWVTAYAADFQMPEITQKIVDEGAVLVYFKTNGLYIMLPWIINQGDNITANLMSLFLVGGVSLKMEYNMVVEGGEVIAPMTFKIVIIDGPPPVSLNINNYDAVKEFYELSD